MENCDENTLKTSFLQRWQGLNLSTEMSVKELYLWAFRYAQDILDDFFQNNSYDVPEIDIRALVGTFGIEIVEMEIKLNSDVFRYGMPGYLDGYGYKGNKRLWTIYINESMGDLSKRYIIAHEFAHYLLLNQKEQNIKNCTNPLFPKKTEEQLCDLLASFLLMPLKTVLELMNNYIIKCQNDNSGPIDMYEWLHYLGCELRISDYHTVLCFQNIRYLGGIIWETQGCYKNEEICNEELWKNIKDNYEKLFK